MKRINLKKIFGLMLAFAMLFTLAACGSKDDSTNETTTSDDTEATGDLAGTVTITGSTSVEKILLDMADEFMAYNPDVTVNYTGTGSSAGIEDAIAGANDLGASSRALKEEETAEGLEFVEFAYDGIAIVVHPSNQLADLTMEDLLKIYSGEITNWSEVGGSDENIVVVSREGASGTRGAFEELIGLEDIGLTENATVVEGNGNVQASVAGNENAIGYVSFSFIDETVKALTLEGIVANAENAKEGSYLLARPFLLTYKPENLTDVAKTFLEYVVTSDAQVFVEDHGGIRVD
ncbi:MAG: phosphate transporter substrate-binding protein [Lachnospiraceae bacterium]|jgi:phosphate transport system substrate-binding protein|nr:phosphate transporter substrate-binding protein [Lachnospiraceae bacterium]